MCDKVMKTPIFMVLVDFSAETCCNSMKIFVKNFFIKEILTQVIWCKFWEIFKNTFFIEKLRAIASSLMLRIYSD